MNLGQIDNPLAARAIVASRMACKLAMDHTRPDQITVKIPVRVHADYAEEAREIVERMVRVPQSLVFMGVSDDEADPMLVFGFNRAR